MGRLLGSRIGRGAHGQGVIEVKNITCRELNNVIFFGIDSYVVSMYGPTYDKLIVKLVGY